MIVIYPCKIILLPEQKQRKKGRIVHPEWSPAEPLVDLPVQGLPAEMRFQENFVLGRAPSARLWRSLRSEAGDSLSRGCLQTCGWFRLVSIEDNRFHRGKSPFGGSWRIPSNPLEPHFVIGKK
ncbi:MAG: hypothetical protein K2G93_01530 [Rikenella sp.]|nr:hypothetical protein [Rikenella sp.]